MLEVVAWLVLAGSPEAVSFQTAVERALGHNPALLVAAQDTARARAQLEQARAPSLPTLGLSGTFTRLDDDRRLGDRLVLGKEQFSGAAQLGVPLVATPRWAQWYRASKNVDAVAAASDDVRRQVAVAAARAWLSTLAARRVVDAATSASEAARAHLEFASERLKGGVGTRIDELRAAQEYSASAAQLESAKASLVRAQETLGVQVGSDEPLDVASAEPDFSSALAAPDALHAAGARLDVKAAQVRKASLASAASTDWMDYLPLLNAVFAPFYQNPPSLTQPLTGWQLNVVLQLPLYDGALRCGQAKERRANAAAADAQYVAVLRQARSEVRGAFEQVTHADAGLNAARDSAEQASEALELANVAYRAGATTNLEVIDAERRARDAQITAVLAEDLARQSRLDVLVASGKFPPGS
jgi:outer membrane protein